MHVHTPNAARDLQAAGQPPFLVSPINRSEQMIRAGEASKLANLPFSEAADLWIASKGELLRKRTLVGYKGHLEQLNKVFGTMRVRDIHVGHLLSYQTERSNNSLGRFPRKAGPSLVNHELVTVQQVMKRAKVWSQIGDLYTALPIPDFQKPKVMDDLEEQRLFKVATTRPEWEIALLVITISRFTGACGCELRNLRLEDVILDAGEPRLVIRAETAKNKYRGRVVGLLDAPRLAIERCIELGRTRGTRQPSDYIFPFRVRPGVWDPTKPTTDSWLRRSFKKIAEAAGVPWITPHCLRHQFITEILAKGAAPQTVRHIVGHVSEEMMNHYSHNRMETQMQTLRLLEPAAKESPAKRFRSKMQREAILKRRRRLSMHKRPSVQ